uniref:NIT domain-containing protein n=1 Tax=Macrostomum lignano TaxID=282301 RepID=A0A1I8GG53_9PLAT
MDMSKLVGSLQIERGLTATFLASNGTDMVFYQRIKNQRVISDAALEGMSIWPPIEYFYYSNTSSGYTVPIRPLYTKADMAANLAWFRRRVDTIAYEMQTIDSPDFYTPFINMLMDWGDSTAIFPPGSKLWTQMLAFSAILRVTEAIGLQRALGSSWFINCHLPPELF